MWNQSHTALHHLSYARKTDFIWVGCKEEGNFLKKIKIKSKISKFQNAIWTDFAEAVLAFWVVKCVRCDTTLVSLPKDFFTVTSDRPVHIITWHYISHGKQQLNIYISFIPSLNVFLYININIWPVALLLFNVSTQKWIKSGTHIRWLTALITTNPSTLVFGWSKLIEVLSFPINWLFSTPNLKHNCQLSSLPPRMMRVCLLLIHISSDSVYSHVMSE